MARINRRRLTRKEKQTRAWALLLEQHITRFQAHTAQGMATPEKVALVTAGATYRALLRDFSQRGRL